MNSKRPKLTLVFLQDEQRILLGMKKRRHGVGKWNGLGGKLEPGETVEQGAVRECQEECGVTITKFSQRGILHFYQEPYVDKYSNIDVHVFVATTWEGEPTESEEMLPKWFNVSEVPYENMWPADAYWLPQILKGHIVKGEFLFDDTYALVKQTVTIVEDLSA